MANNVSNDLNKTRYTHRDYESIKSDLINAIPSLTQEWTSREESDPGIVLIKLMAMFGDTLSYNVDKMALELYIQTVTQRKNCSKILELLGYKMHWYRSARVMAHVRLVANQDEEGNIRRVILRPYVTTFLAGNLRYTVISQNADIGEIDVDSNVTSVDVKLIEGIAQTQTFSKTTLIKNKYYFGDYNVDESEILLSVDNVTNTQITCELTENLNLVSSNSIIYYEFNTDEYDRPYIKLADGWEDITGSDESTFTVTYILSSGAAGNVSSNAFTSVNGASGDTSSGRLVITNFSNLTKYGSDGAELDSYNSKGYSPQTVANARIDSANYVFTHDTLVTSFDFEKACKRVPGITVSKMVDAQVIINDQLDLDEICSRATDSFSKITEVDADTGESSEYLLNYQVIMYLAYLNFQAKYNFYYTSLSQDNIWNIRPQYDFDPYGREYWEPTLYITCDGETTSYPLSSEGPHATDDLHIGLNVTLNRTEIKPWQFSYDSNTGKITIFENAPKKVTLAIINEKTNKAVITDLSYVYDKDNDKGVISITDNYPTAVTELTVSSEPQEPFYSYDSETDTIVLDETFELGDVLAVQKLYYDKNGNRLQAPGYYPYKPTTNVLLSVIDLIKSLQMLNVRVDYGTLKLFPFKVDGILHLLDNYSPAETLQVVINVNNALNSAYYPNLHDIGEKPNFIELVDIIQNADVRVKYFDAVSNIVEWAPEVQKRLSDMETIFDSTSAIMYNGLSSTFNLSKRFLKYKLRNVGVTYDSSELPILGGSESTANVPADYGTAYLVNYSAAANLKYVKTIEVATQEEMQLNNIKELAALCDDLLYRGQVDLKYIRTYGLNVATDLDLENYFSYEQVEEFAGNNETTNFVSNVLETTHNEFTTWDTAGVSTPFPLARIVMSDSESTELTFPADYKDDDPTNITILTSSNNKYCYGYAKIGGQYNIYLVSIISSEVTVTNNTIVLTDINTSMIDGIIIQDENKTIIVDSFSYTQNGNTGVIELDTTEYAGKNATVYAALPIGEYAYVQRGYYTAEFSIRNATALRSIIFNDFTISSLTIYSSATQTFTDFEDASAGVINKDTNSDILDYINDNSDVGYSLAVKLCFGNGTSHICTFITSKYVDEINDGRELKDDQEIVIKTIVINNTGLQYIEEK